MITTVKTYYNDRILIKDVICLLASLESQTVSVFKWTEIIPTFEETLQTLEENIHPNRKPHNMTENPILD